MTTSTTNAAQKSARGLHATTAVAANGSADQAVQTLQNQWYNVIVAALGLNNQTFQLVEATDPLPNTTKDGSPRVGVKVAVREGDVAKIVDIFTNRHYRFVHSRRGSSRLILLNR